MCIGWMKSRGRGPGNGDGKMYGSGYNEVI